MVRGLDETWLADLVDMSVYVRYNNGYKYLLTIIDIFSKYAWTVPTKTKSGKDMTDAMNSVFKEGRVPRKLHVDQGKESYNIEFKALMQRYDITVYSTFSNLKASICERFNRTLKGKMWKQFSLRGTYKWTDIVNDLLFDYNNTMHRTIRMKPKDVTARNETSLLRNVYGRPRVNRTRKIKFKIGEKVRISKSKHIYEKGYTPNWTTEIFVISEVKNTHPVTYKLVDYQDHPIEGNFYQEELIKVQYSDAYLVELIVLKRGNKVFVKWLGFDNSHNSWINESYLTAKLYIMRLLA